MALAVLAAQETPKDNAIVFGTTVVSSTGFHGQIYHLKRDVDSLPRLERGKPVGTIYTK
jgi:hypothetical protein